MDWWNKPNQTLDCGHCGATFIATPSQVKHHKYEHRAAFCSPICRTAEDSRRKRRPKPVYGPCPTCGERFESRVPKTYCSMQCYVRSPAFQEQARTLSQYNVPRTKRREDRNCLTCGAVFQVIGSSSKKFCSAGHYRAYMAKRFDRWIANPQNLALPQAYDEFLNSEELSCLVEGCNWRGHWLSLHMNFAHGVPADEFKRAAGFNLKSGIISAPMRESLAQRPQCLAPGQGEYLTTAVSHKSHIRNYQSLEGKEHRHKAMALMLGQQGPTRTCKGCGQGFRQQHLHGRRLFCSFPCRDEWYRQQNAKQNWMANCATCGSQFHCTRYRYNRMVQGMPVCCSLSCRQALNGARPRRAAKAQTSDRP